jgi:hypothetical protein
VGAAIRPRKAVTRPQVRCQEVGHSTCTYRDIYIVEVACISPLRRGVRVNEIIIIIIIFCIRIYGGYRTLRMLF